MQNKGYYAVQDHSRSSRPVPIESPYATSYQWLVVTDILCRTVSELSQLIVQILDTLRFWAPPPLLGLGTTHDVHLGLIGKRLVDFLLVLIEPFSLSVTSENRSKIGHFAPTRSVWTKMSGSRDRPHQSFLHGFLRPINVLQLCRWQFSHTKKTIAYFLQAKSDFTPKTAVLRFWAPLRA